MWSRSQFSTDWRLGGSIGTGIRKRKTDGLQLRFLSTDLLLSALSRSDAAADNADAQHRFVWHTGTSINQLCFFRVVQVTKSLQDPLEVGNSLPGISDNVRERGLEQKCF